MFGIKKFIKKSWGGTPDSPQQTRSYTNLYNNIFGIKHTDNFLINQKILTKETRYNIAKNHTIVSKAFDIILNHASNVDIVLKQRVGNEINIITKHPIIDLLNNPNGLYVKTEIDFIKKLLFEDMAGGEYYILYDEVSEILEVIESTNIAPKDFQNNNSFVTEYVVTNYATRNYDTRNTNTDTTQLNFKYNPVEQYYESCMQYDKLYKKDGITPLPCYKLFVFQDIQNRYLDNQYRKSKISQNIHFIAIYENVQNALFYMTSKALNNSILTINHKKDNVVINEYAIKEMKIGMQKEVNSTSNSGQIAILENNDADFNILPLNKLEYDHFEMLLNDIEKKLMLGLGIPLKMIEASKDSNTSGEMLNIANMQLYKEQILPMLNKILQHLGGFLFNVFDCEDKGYFLDVDLSSIQEYKQAEANVNINLFKNNVITRNEARAKIGLPPLDNDSGEAFFNANSLQQQNSQDNLL